MDSLIETWIRLKNAEFTDAKGNIKSVSLTQLQNQNIWAVDVWDSRIPKYIDGRRNLTEILRTEKYRDALREFKKNSWNILKEMR